MAHCSFCEMTEEQATRDERERIIQLLEYELWDEFQKSHKVRAPWATMELLIRAIKGDKNA